MAEAGERMIRAITFSAHEKARGLSAYTSLLANMPDLVLASLFLNVLTLALPVALLQVYDRIIPNKSEGTLQLLVLGVGIALLFEAGLRMGRSYITGWVGARFEHMAGCGAMARLLGASIGAFERDGSGAHLERFNALATVKDFYAGQAILTLLDLPFTVIFLFLVWFIAQELVLIPAGLLVLFLITALGIGSKLREALKKRMTADDRRFNFIIEVLSGIHTVKSMGMEAQMLRRYERLQEGCAEGDYHVAQVSSSALSLASFFSQLTTAAVAAYGSTLVLDHRLTVGGLAACTMLAGRSLSPVQKALGIWTRFQTIRLARTRLNEIFQLQMESQAGLPRLPPVAGRVQMDGVRFRYSEKTPEILQGLSVDIAAGECVAIGGGNGSGKSTLLALMIGALRPSAGRVLLDGYDLAEVDPMNVKSQVAYLPQSGTLFQGSILENITMFRPELTERAHEAAGRLGLDDVVKTMALGYDTRVGDGAFDALPRGIKQRIAVARALVCQPRVVLFDEANTGVDGVGDQYLKTCLEELKGRCTLILVTHRPSLVKLADRAFDFKDGLLTERKQVTQAPAAPVAAQAAPQGNVA